MLLDLADSDDDLSLVGLTLAGEYEIVAPLGSGSMATVYRAKRGHQEVAIKILQEGRAFDEAAKRRFLREARLQSALVSPHTVRILDFGECDHGELFLAMELLEGETLGKRLARVGRLAPEAAIDVALQVLRSLSEAHQKGIVHRDLKPENIFFCKRATREIVKVIDFGVAKAVRRSGAWMNVIQTREGRVFGTPRYMSPEQAQAQDLDCRSDLYSLGVILYHMLVGRPPFTDDDAVVVMARHIRSKPRPLDEACPEANIPPALERAVLAAMSKDPDDRPATAEAMAADLRAVGVPAGPEPAAPSALAPARTRTRPRLFALAPALAFALFVAADARSPFAATLPAPQAHAETTLAIAAMPRAPDATQEIDISALPAAPRPAPAAPKRKTPTTTKRPTTKRWH